MGSAFKADADNVQAGLPLLNWEESSVSNETYNVTFDVKNAAGEAVQGATVRVYTKSDMSDDSEVKAEGGVLALRSGTYYYKASADGYLDTKSSFKVDGKETVVTVTMQTEAQVTFNVKPASATFTLTDSAKAEVTPVSAGDGVYKYSLAAGAYYSYTASASGYNGTTREFTAAAGTYDVELTKSSYNPGDSDKMVYGSKNAGKTHTVTAGGTYYIGSGAEGTLTVNTTDAVTLVGKGVSESDVYNNLSINCVQAGTKLTIQDVYMKYELTDTNMILFSGSDNYLNFKGTNILDKDTGASGYAMIYVPKGTDLTVSGGSGDYLYMYKRDQGAGIGGNGNAKGPEGQTPQYNGDITIDGGNYFMKNSKQGALIGAGAGAGTVIGSPGSIEINDASMYLIAESRAAAIGGSAGDKASAGSEITVNDSLITVNVDWSGSAIGGGGFDGGNDVDGGKLIYESGSIRTFIDRNAAGSWNVSGPCVNDVAITADKVNAKGNAVYMCAVDTSKLKSSKSYVTVKSDGTSVYSGGLHEWEFVDAYNAKNTTTVNYTIDNWVRCDDTCVYVYLTGEDHTLDVNGETVSAKWDASGKTFTLTYSDGSTSNGGSGGGSLTDDKTPLVSEVIKPDTKVSGSNASASVKKDDVDGAVKAVGDSSNAEIVIDSVSSKSGITHIEVSVPMESVKTIQKDTKADIVLKTDLGNITVDNRDLSAITAGTGSDVTFTIDKNSDGSMKLGITSGGKNIAAGKYILKYKYKIDGAVMKALAGKTGVDNSDLAGVLLGAKGADGKVTQTIIRDSFVTADGYLILNAPAGGTVTVAANGRSFSDVAASAWYAKAVGFAVSHELFNGVSDNEFAPSKSMTRGMFVTVLNRLAGEEDFSGKTEFTDVPADAWYATGTAWAASKGIVNGYGDGKFGPNDPVTREQMAVIMYNFTKAMGYDIKGNAALTKFSDSASVHSWAAEAMQWAVGTGVMSGNSDGTLDPRGTATRAQVATIMSNYIQVLLGVK